MKKVKVAHIMGKMNGGGVESFVLNYFKQIDKSKFEFDFICDNDSKNIPYEEIKKLGGNIILIPPYQNFLKYQKQLQKILSENDYDIVHSHINTLSIFPLYSAWKSKIKVRIAHSHSTAGKGEFKKNIMKSILKHFSKIFATDYCACSIDAAKFQFGKRSLKKVNIINNAIDVNKFQYNDKIRNKIRNELNIHDEFVIGHVGRFVTTKNQKFLVELLSKIDNENVILVLVGIGELQNRVKQLVHDYNLDNKVLFLNQRNDVNELMQCFDMFCLPSLYEGLGIVLIEAQISDLNCLVSSRVPLEAKISNRLIFRNLDTNLWKKEIENVIKNDYNRSKVVNKNYDIKIQVKKLEDYYINLVNKEVKNESICCNGKL